jgi:hypothetical protein
MFAHHFLLDRGIELCGAGVATRSRQCQFGRTALCLAAECEQQWDQPHRFVSRPAVQASDHGRTFAGDMDRTYPPSLGGEADPHAT